LGNFDGPFKIGQERVISQDQLRQIIQGCDSQCKGTALTRPHHTNPAWINIVKTSQDLDSPDTVQVNSPVIVRLRLSQSSGQPAFAATALAGSHLLARSCLASDMHMQNGIT